MGAHGKPQCAAVGQRRLRIYRFGEVRPVGFGHVVCVIKCCCIYFRTPWIRIRSRHHSARRRCVCHVVQGRHGGCVPGGVTRTNVYVAAVEAATFLRLSSGDCAHSSWSHSRWIRASVHSSSQRTRTHHIFASTLGKLTGQNTGCAVVSRTTHANGNRCCGLHCKRGRPVAPSNGFQAFAGTHATTEATAIRGHGRARYTWRHCR